jgi:cytochrome c oxidase subunit 4
MANGTKGHEHEEHEEHSAIGYIVVWLILIVLTITTYVTGKAHLGAWALPIAMIIATTKGVLVAIIFMHLSESTATTRLVFVVSLVFVGILIAFSLSDVATRFRPSTPAGAPFGTERSQPAGLLEHQMPE